MTHHALKILMYVLLAASGIFVGAVTGRQCAWQATHRSNAVNNLVISVVVLAGIASRIIFHRWDLGEFLICVLIVGIPGIYEVNRTELNRPELMETDWELD